MKLPLTPGGRGVSRPGVPQVGRTRLLGTTYRHQALVLELDRREGPHAETQACGLRSGSVSVSGSTGMAFGHGCSDVCRMASSTVAGLAASMEA